MIYQTKGPKPSFNRPAPSMHVCMRYLRQKERSLLTIDLHSGRDRRHGRGTASDTRLVDITGVGVRVRLLHPGYPQLKDPGPEDMLQPARDLGWLPAVAHAAEVHERRIQVLREELRQCTVENQFITNDNVCIGRGDF